MTTTSTSPDPRGTLLRYGIGYSLVCSSEYWPRIAIEPDMAISISTHAQKLLFLDEKDYKSVYQDYISWQRKKRGLS